MITPIIFLTQESEKLIFSEIVVFCEQTHGENLYVSSGYN